MELIGHGRGAYLQAMVQAKAGVEYQHILGVPFYVVGGEAWVWPELNGDFGAVYSAVLHAAMVAGLTVHSVPTTIAAKMHLRTSRRVDKKLSTGEVVYSRPVKRQKEHPAYVEWTSEELGWSWVGTAPAPTMRPGLGFEEYELAEAAWHVDQGSVITLQHVGGAYAWVTEESGGVPRVLFSDLVYDIQAPAVFCRLCEEVVRRYEASSILLGSVGSNNHKISRRMKAHCLRAFLSYSTVSAA